jgi:hypothetical protein
VSGHLVEHVFEKRKTGLQARTTRTVEVEPHGNLGLKCVPADLGGSLRHEGGSEGRIGRKSENSTHLRSQAPPEMPSGRWGFMCQLPRLDYD